jgi:energy-coupling factor transporter ATP-binding protein EcfA2
MLRQLKLTHYKGFSEFQLTFGDQALLVGANNAGKTTIIAALRLCASLLGQARRLKPDAAREYDGRWVYSYHFSSSPLGFIDENVRHEFREAESRLELRFKNDARMHVIWPVDDMPFFYLETRPGMQPRRPADVKATFSTIGVVPILTPIEHDELVLTSDHIKDNLSSRLVSRHFRNQVNLLSNERYEEFHAYVLEWTPEISRLALGSSITTRGRELDLYYLETVTQSEKELFWAGDGLQVWLQVLYHVWRQRDVTTLVLDEPDVFLHPDMQRRLVHLLEAADQQVILASHAPEVLNEARRNSVIWVDRTRRTARRAPDEALLAKINDTLGSGFDLRIARAMRARMALFVEGQDMRLLRNVARTIGAQRLATEDSVAIIQLQGFSNWYHVEPFSWLSRELLGEAVRIFLILDRDYRTRETVDKLFGRLRETNIDAHVWERKELESYFIIPSALARLSGVEENLIGDLLEEACEAQRVTVMARFLEERQRVERSAERHAVTITEQYLPVFDRAWRDPQTRLSISNPKELLHYLNNKLPAMGGRAVSFRALSSRAKSNEVPQEMRLLLLEIERQLIEDQ